MIAATRGIVFHTINYSDSTVIAKIFTEAFGLRSYLVNSAHSKRSSTKSNLLQPLSLIEIVAYEKERKQLQRVKEIRTDVQYNNIGRDISRNTIVLFLNEVLYNAIREEEKNPFLFEFIHSAMQILDLLHVSPANFHLSFLAELSKHLGFYPRGNYSEFCTWFDLHDGEFVPERPVHPNFLGNPHSKQLFLLMTAGFEKGAVLSISNAERKVLLQSLLYYYKTHLEPFGELKSPRVLEEVLG